MSPGLADLLVVGLATWQVVEIARHARITLGARRLLRRLALIRGWLGLLSWPCRLLDALASCGFCLSVWVAAAMAAARTRGGGVVEWATLALAASRLANLGNDLTYLFCRTPRHDLDEDEHEQHETGDEPDGDPGGAEQG